MPRVSYTQTFKTAGEVEKFPELKLRTAEKSRGWLPDEPWMEWYHRIEAPLIIDGEVQMEIKDTKSRGKVEVQKMDWIASAFCVGLTGTPDNPGPLILEGIDPANCPVCESAANSTGVKAPEQRFAAPIIKYKIRGRGQNPYALITPTSAEVLVWAYTSRQHGMLHDLAAREDMDLRKLDITIDLEDTPGADTYQKIKTLAAIREPAWRDPKVREYLLALWSDEENRPTDEQLRVACKGRDYARPVLMDMVRRAERQWRDSERGGGSGGDLGAADAGFNGTLDEGIGALLGDPSADAGRSDTSAQVSPGADDDPLADHPGGTEEFMSDEQRAALADAKAQAQRDIAAVVSPDPFADLGPTAPAATTTSTAAPAAENRSRTAPRSAGSAPGSSDSPLPDDERARAVEEAADGMFGEPSGDSAPPEPARGNGRRHSKAKAEETKPEPEPAAAPAGSGGIIDFDDLFAD